MNWITKQRQRRTSANCDVSVAVNKDGHTSFTFKNNSYNKITSTGYVILAKEGNRIYFGGSTRYEGFKLTSFSVDKSKATIKVKPLQFEIGDYNLEFDKDQALFYIDANRKLK